jgi:hypothetical protein
VGDEKLKISENGPSNYENTKFVDKLKVTQESFPNYVPAMHLNSNLKRMGLDLE